MQAATIVNEAEATGTSQYLTFICAGEEYGVEILCVQEIKGWENVTRVPYTPHYLLGVMNLRGVIVPVIDLRVRFGLPARAMDGSTVVVVVRVRSSHGEKTAGIVVDAVFSPWLERTRTTMTTVELSMARAGRRKRTRRSMTGTMTPRRFMTPNR